MPTKKCAWGLCKSDSRYPERHPGVSFIPFLKPGKHNYHLQECQRWIKACNRPHDQLNIQKLGGHHYICSKHFVDGRPTAENPDPVSADPGDRAQRKRKKHQPFNIREHKAGRNRKRSKLVIDSNTEALETEEQVQKCFLSITDDCIVKQWQMVGTLEGLREDNDIAQFLLNFYFTSQHQINGKPKPTIHCAFCQSSLVPIWSCRVCQKQFSFATTGDSQCCPDQRLQDPSAPGERSSVFQEAEVKKENLMWEEAEVFERLAAPAVPTFSDRQKASPVPTNSDEDEWILEKVKQEKELPVEQSTSVRPAADKTNANQLQSRAFNGVQVEASVGSNVAQNSSVNNKGIQNLHGVQNVHNIQSKNVSQVSSVKTSSPPFNIKSIQKQTRSISTSMPLDLRLPENKISCASKKKEREPLSQSGKLVQKFPTCVKVSDQKKTVQAVNMPKIFYLSQKNAVDNLIPVKVYQVSPSVCKVLLPSDVRSTVSSPVPNKVLLPSDVKTTVTRPVSRKVLLPSGSTMSNPVPNKVLLSFDVKTTVTSPVSRKVLLPSDVKTAVSSPVPNASSTILQYLFSDNDSLVQHRAADALPQVARFSLKTVISKKDQANIQQNLQKRGQNHIIHKSELNSKIFRNFQSSRVSCKMCFQSFYSQRSLHTHVLAKHKEHDLFCEKCKAFYSTTKGFHAHLRRHKNTSRYLCEYCGKMFCTTIEMNNHQNIHLGCLKPYVCKDCGKNFARQSHLQSHMLTHTQVKKFICDQCGKAFAWAANMRNHRKGHEKQTVS